MAIEPSFMLGLVGDIESSLNKYIFSTIDDNNKKKNSGEFEGTKWICYGQTPC